MSKCENCIHDKVCLHQANIQTDTYAYMGVNYDTENCTHYKDKSLFVELPCKVGDTVWCLDGYCDDSFAIIERIVMKFTVFKDTIKFMAKLPNKVGWEKPYDIVQIGKTVFLTKEEAERKLREVGE